MHPNPLFRSDDRAGMAALVDTIGFGMIFAQAPIGPRVVHTPLVMAGEERVRFHISRANALAGHLDGADALAVINGPDGYISPRWYADRDTVPTWDYVALEMEGPVRPLAHEELESFLHALIARSEARLDGAPWLAYHWYDRDQGGLPKLALTPLGFDEEGWPAIAPPQL